MNKKTVLCVDDEINVLRALRRELMGEPYEVVVASSGQEGLEHLEAKKIAVVVSDHRMPGMTGSEFLAKVRERWPDTFRIMMTGYADVDTMTLAVNEGRIHHFLYKPWSSNELKLAVRQCIAELEASEAERKQVGKEQLEELVRHLPYGVCLLDGEQRLVLVNSSAQEYLAVLTDPILLVAVGEVVSHIGKHTIEEILEPRVDGLMHEVAVEGPPQRTFEVGASSITKGVTEGGWVLVLREVTLEREVLERAQQQDRLVEVGQLAAGIAHDFNNILSIMMGFAETLEMSADLPDSDKEDLRRIVLQGQRAAQLIRLRSSTSAVRALCRGIRFTWFPS